MKKMLLTFAITAGTMLQVDAQTGTPEYVPFPTSEAVWTQRIFKDEVPVVTMAGLKNVAVVIDGRTYHEVYRDDNLDLLTASPVGGLREEDKRIYFYNYATSQEVLLYDFNLRVGDYFNFNGYMPVPVSSIETVTIDGKDRRQINFAFYWASWIEGIGNARGGGLLGFAVPRSTHSINVDLICFRQSGKWLYHNSYVTASCDGHDLAIDETSVAKASISLYPNPVSGSSRIHIEGLTKGEIRIYDRTGKQVQQYTLSGNNDILINSSDYMPGIYCYRLTDASDAQLKSGLFEVRP